MAESDRYIEWKNGDAVVGQQEVFHQETKADILNSLVYDRLQSMSRGQRQELVERTSEWVFNEGLRIGDEAIPMIPFPILQDKDSNAHHAESILHVHEAAIKIEELAFSGSPEGNAIIEDVQNGMFEEGRRLMMAARKVPREQALRRVVRFDTFSQNGTMSMIEANTIATEGVHFHDLITRAGIGVLQDLSIEGVDFENERKVTIARQVFATLCEMVNDKKGRLPKAIGVVYETEGEDNAINNSELPYVIKTFNNLAQEIGVDMEMVTGRPSDVDAHDGRMSVNGQEVDVIWRNNINPQDYKGISTNGGNVNADGMLEVMANPDIYPILNDDRTRFEGYKETMAYLHNPRIQTLAGLTPEEIAAVNEIVPFTFDPSGVDTISFRGQEMGTRQFLTTFSNHFVIKPKVGTHGNGVVFGINDGQIWDNAVNEAIEGGQFIAQQYIPYESIVYPTPTVDADGDLYLVKHYMDTNMHVAGGRVLGTNICRSSPVDRFDDELGVLNIAAGGGARPSLRV